MGFRIGQDLEGEGKETVAGQDGGGLVEPPVGGGLAPAKVVVVHAGQVVVDQRVGVQGFDRRRRPGRPTVRRAEQARPRHHQVGT